MPRSKVSDEKRNEIVSLRQKKTKWTEIQKLTGVDRRNAKNIYEKFERTSSIEELQKVRKEVAKEEFRTHMESIVRLAESLVSNLDILPGSIGETWTNSEEFLKWLFDQDLLQRYSLSKPDIEDYGLGDSQSFHSRDPRIYLDEKRLLYKALRDHTQREVQWNILDIDWKNARDRCAKSAPQFIKETRELVDSYFKNANEPKFLEIVKKTTQKKDPAGNITSVIANGIWKTLLEQNLKEPLFKTVAGTTTSIEILLKYGDMAAEMLFRLVGSDRQYVAQRIIQQCNSAITVLSNGNTAKELQTEVKKIRAANETIREMLNPLKLRSIILRTSCNLCTVPL